MTVAELIAKLSTMNQDLVVMIRDGDLSYVVHEGMVQEDATIDLTAG